MVYLEPFVAYNFFMNACLLALTKRACGLCAKKRRLFGAALLGAALCAPIVCAAGFFRIFLGLALAVLMLFCAFGLPNRRLFVKITLLFWAASLLVGGAGVSLCAAAGARLGPGALVLLAPLPAFAGLWLFCDARKTRSQSVHVEFTLPAGEKMRAYALIDTGNRMIEPLSGLPVALWKGQIDLAGCTRTLCISTPAGQKVLPLFGPAQALADGKPLSPMYFAMDPGAQLGPYELILPPGVF